MTRAERNDRMIKSAERLLTKKWVRRCFAPFAAAIIKRHEEDTRIQVRLNDRALIDLSLAEMRAVQGNWDGVWFGVETKIYDCGEGS